MTELVKLQKNKNKATKRETDKNQEETQSKRAGKSNAGNISPAWGRQTEITK